MRGGVLRGGVLQRVVAAGAVMGLVASGCVAVQLVSPAPAAAATASATTIAAGYTHTCVIRSGAAYCWGDNTYGELGNNSTMSSSVPVAVNTGGALAGVTLAQISAGYELTCALSTAGAAYCWGSDATGQLGNNSTTQSNVPVAVSTSGVLAGVTLTQISTGGSAGFACALSSAGAAYCWGANTNGELGNNSTTQTNVPVAVSTSGVLGGVTLTQITSGDASACALATMGAAYCWGFDTNGQLGNNSTTQSTVPVAVSGGLTFSQINSGANHSCALTTAGAVWCWGYNGNGQLGNNSTTQSLVPVAVTATGVLSGVTLAQISTGYQVSCALSAAGTAYCWGQGALGNGTTGQSLVPVTVTATGVLSGVTLAQLSAGGSATGPTACVLSSTGAAYCWGNNATGQVGNPATGVNFPVPVAVMSESTMIASGYSHSCLLRNGKAYCWGDDTYGELGNNTTTTTPVSTPVAVYTAGALSGLTLIQISAGQDWTCALASTGAAYCWGNNSIAVSGDTIDLGNNTNTASSAPVLVSGGLFFTQISVGGDFACGLTSAGVAYCWGNNRSDQMGNGGGMASIVPGAVTVTGVLSGLTLTQIDAGSSYTCALASTGAAYCWGLGTSGQLGNSASTTSSRAVAVTASGVLSGVTLVQITTGGTSTCALGSSGAAYCWGAGDSGQLGNGSTTAIQNTAVAVTATSTGMPLTQITAGTSFACAVDVTGAAWCWGLGTPGDQLGNNLNASSSTPVAVTATGVLAGVILFQISSGQVATCAQGTTGAFYCWGTNTNSQLGNASTTSSDVPVTVAGIVPGAPTSVAAFPASTTAAVYWVTPASLGTGTLTGYLATASPGGATCTTTTALSCTITGLANGTTYTITVIARTTDGNSANSTAATVTPWPPGAIAAGGRESSCTIYSGKAYCWGDDSDGELGNGVTTATAQLTPVAVSTGGVLAGVTLTQITMGYWHVCALASTGAVYCWGYDVDGELGNGTTSSTPSNVPVLVSGGLTFTQISAGQYSTCGVTSAGAVYCWGLGSSGQLGVSGSTASSSTPVAVTTTGTALAGRTIVQVAAGYYHTCALDNTGLVYCWGTDTYGQLGNNTTSTTAQPAATAVYTTGTPMAGRTIVQITAGGQHTCALDSIGLAYCWGYGTNGQLGNSTTTSAQSVPVAVYTAGALAGVTLATISATEFHTCALGSTGLAFCWGYNADGRLGTNNTTTTSVPAAVYTGGALSGRTLTQVGAGDQDSCALDSAGIAYCWGNDGNGQLGNDSTAEANAAVLVGPQAPTSVTATPGSTTAAVSWTAPVFLNNGTLTGYTATTSPGAFTCTSTSATSCTVTGLTSGATYTITVTTTATTGTSAPSAPASVTVLTGTLTNPAWSASSTVLGATGVSYTYTFTTASTSTLSSVTMTVSAGTAGTPVVGTVTPSSMATGGSVSLVGTTLTYTFTAVSVSSGTAVSIKITGLTNTPTPGNYTSVITTRNGGTAVDSATAASVAFTGVLASPAWSASSTVTGTTGVSYTYTFTTATTSTLSSVTMTVPAGTPAGTPAVGTVTPSSVATGGSVSLAGTTLTYTFTAVSVPSGTAVSIQVTGLKNTATAGSYTSVITTKNGGTAVDSGTAAAVTFPGVLTSPGWSASSTTTGATGVSYTYTFTVPTTATLSSITMTVPAGTSGTPVVGTVLPSTPPGAAVSLAGTTLTYSFTPVSVPSGTVSSIQITGLTNTSAAGSYTSVLTASNGGTTVDSGTAPAVTFTGALVSPAWYVSSAALSATGITYTYTFTTATTSTLSSVTMTVPAGTAGTPAVGTVTPASVATGGSVALAGSTLTYTFTAVSVPSGTAVSIKITGLTNTSTTGSYTSAITTRNGGTQIDSGTSLPISFPGTVTLTSPGSLTWSSTLSGKNQQAVDTNAADQQLTVSDSTGTAAGWHVTASATTFTASSYTIPSTGAMDVTGSVTSVASTAPSATCVGSCVLPTDTTTYPVLLNTASSAPPPFTLYDTSSGTGVGQVTLGGSTATYPIGWWMNVPGNAHSGTYTSTVTLAVVSGP